MVNLDENTEKWGDNGINDCYKHVKAMNHALEEHFGRQYNPKAFNKVSSQLGPMPDLINNGLLNKKFVEGDSKKKDKEPLLIKFDKVVRNYLYDMYEHIEEHSNTREIKGPDATKVLNIDDEA